MAADTRTTAAAYTVRPLDPSTWDAFEELCASSDGYPSGCWCNGMHAEGLTREAAANRERKRRRVLDGTTHAALVFVGADGGDRDRCVGWCQYGPADEIVHIKNRRRYDQTQDGPPPDWRIGCNYVRAGHRRQGVATTALRGALDLIAAAGGGRVEGYPEPAGTVPAGFLFHGALSTFEQAGFTRDRRIGKHRWVVTRTVWPAAPAI